MTPPGPAGPESRPTGTGWMPRRRFPAGDVLVYGSDEQQDQSIDMDRWMELARRALHTEGVRGDAELALLFVDEAAMRELNRQFMGEDRPTDVLAFPIDDDAPGGRWPDAGPTGPDRPEPLGDALPVLLGDVVLCPAVAARQAPEHNCSFEDELALLVVHGILHILGHDHAEPEETAVMKGREQALLDEHYRPPPRG